MNIPKALRKCGKAIPGLILVLAILQSQGVFAQSLDIPTKKWGISFGNSKDFTGLRFNFRDSRVSRVTGINVTLWNPRKDNKDSVIKGISLGLIPGGVKLTGAFLAGIMVRVEQNGRLSGLAASSVNYIRGTVNGLSIGIVNYAWKLEKGLQVGIINIIRDNPKGLKVLPVFNTRF
jgi:hypothetical protein